ncbi:aminoglycoside phosphotransferase family protein [Mycobacterium sp. 94-17]|uniref:phosphotransferase family protein n=1 Tax=Mycobacterium sp. 94-17 TaxID=2986147 RepID=UPI002D1F85B0|nr:aminoglycoside phosphotransferase family protein [Mycobacterium sp. 94-17]MEB4210091.1 aminoglycoside phosphotransferase family protein [Mycobacterium sp. 94-17]
MSKRWVRSTGSSSTRLIDLNQLPIGLIDIELNMPPTELVHDRATFALRPEDGPPTAVLKVARGLQRAAELRTQRRVLAELAIHQGLDDEWRELLPRILAFDERTAATTSVESYRPGIDLADLLARCPGHVEELTVAALTAIAPLHQRTATIIGVDNVCMLRRWVVEPLAALTDMCRRLAPGLVPEVDRLGTMLRQAFVGRRMPVSWTHGDFTPANVRVAGVQGPVTGIVDWGGARPGRPAQIDEYLLILEASCQVERADLGALVAERLRAGGLSARERNSLDAARRRPDGEIAEPGPVDDFVDERVAILLTWLHRVADLWRKRATPPNQHTWFAANVSPVLAGTWHRTNSSHGAPRTASPPGDNARRRAGPEDACPR